MHPRRIVTGLIDGRSAVVMDGPAGNHHAYRGWPGHTTSLVWQTVPGQAAPLDAGAPDPARPGMAVLPAPGGTSLMIVTFQPDSSFADPGFDGALFEREMAEHGSDMAERFDPDVPGMHATDTIDYGILLDGELWLEVDTGEPVRLNRHDIVVQGGVRHAWRNRSDRPAVMAFVLVGALE